MSNQNGIRGQKILVGIADDHSLLRHGVKTLIGLEQKYEVIFDAGDGSEVITAIGKGLIPDILLLDIQMQKVHGKETCEWVAKHFPDVKIIILSMCQEETVIVDMIIAGASGFISKNASPEVLLEQLEKLCMYGVCFSEKLTSKLVKGIHKIHKLPKENVVLLSDNEKQFLFYLCQEYTHEEIAGKMHLSPRTIEDYSNRLTRKLHVRGKSGLIVYAVTHNLHQSE